MKKLISALSLASVIALLGASMVGTSAIAAHHESGASLVNLDVETRPAKDKARDEGRKPAEVLAFLGIESGMTVMDLMASGGYYTEVLSIAVGETGTVYAQNPPMFLQWNDGVYEKAITKRLEGGRLANVTRINSNIGETGLAPASVDAVISALNFHDIYNSDPATAVAMLKGVLVLLKPGAVVGIIDHHGNHDADNNALHRMDENLVIAAAKEAGFEIDATSDILSNPADDRTQGVFSPDVRGKTDRFLLRLKKPR